MMNPVPEKTAARLIAEAGITVCELYDTVHRNLDRCKLGALHDHLEKLRVLALAELLQVVPAAEEGGAA